MKTSKELFAVRRLTLAVQGALMLTLAMPLVATAEDGDVAALTHPANSVEVGATDVSSSSAKFGEYNGLDGKGAYGVGNFNVRGGDAYDSFDGGDGTHRWQIRGTDLGTTSRELNGDASNQGKWSFGFGYDELRHNISDSYQTPFQGSMGGNTFTLPANFGVINTKYLPAGYTTAPGSNVLTAAQKAAFNTPNVYSQRDNSKFNVGYIIDSNWNVKFDFNHLKQSGAKLQGVGGDQTNGNANGATTYFAGQTPMVLMNPTNYTTDTINLALNWAGDKGFATTSYFGSMFRDAYNSVSFNNPFYNGTAATPLPGAAMAFPVDTMSTMPSNNFNQFNLTGGYNFTSATKVVGGYSYGRNTQNDDFAQQGLTPNGFPQNSLNGVVITTHADVKLINQTSKDLQLSASVKYNERNNETASSMYSFYTIQQTPIVNNTTLATSFNAPMSNSKTQFDLDGDYRIDNRQKVNLAYGYEEIKRWCNGVPFALNAPAAATGLTPYVATTCAEVPDSRENKIAAIYKLRASDDLNLSAGYSYADRIANVNPLFYNPMQVGGATSTPYGAGFEMPGFMAYMDASRKEQMLKAGANWQATDKLSLTLNGHFAYDNYDSTYGVQNGQRWSVNFDSTYSYSESGSMSAYATSQGSSRNLTNAQQWSGAAATAATATKLSVPAGAQTWTDKLSENDITLGLGTKKGGLMGGKLELAGDLTYSVGKTDYSNALNYAAADLNGNTCSSPLYMTCGSLPEVKNAMVQLKLGSKYALDKASSVRVSYIYQHLASNDYFYNAYQYGSTPSTLLPTNQQTPSYSVNVISASYLYSF